MGKVKEMIADYIDDARSLEKLAFREEIETLIQSGIFEDKTLLREFLEEVTPLTGPDYFVYVEESKGNYINLRFNREDYINTLCCLSQHPVTLYYHLASFDNWITNEKATSSRCLYVDIDDIGMRADTTSMEDAVGFLKTRYGLTDEQLPQWCILSGNGMHVCYVIDEMSADNEELRETYTSSLITYFFGDFAGLPISHQFRCPESYNMKYVPIKGKLFRLNSSGNTDIRRLDWCLKPEMEIEEYRRSYYSRLTEKRKATVARNKQLEAEFLASLGDITLEQYLSNPSLTPQERSLTTKLLKMQKRKEHLKLKEELFGSRNYNNEDYDLFVYSENCLPYLHLRLYDGYKPHNRTWNLILDLHNFFIRHKGCLVSRNMFFYIVANLFKLKNETKDIRFRHIQGNHPSMRQALPVLFRQPSGNPQYVYIAGHSDLDWYD